MTTEPTIEATLACGDTISVHTAPAIGAYRLCIHCDSRKRVTAVTDYSASGACAAHLVIDRECQQ